MKAIWKNTVIAESENTIVVEGNHYFPADSVHKKYLTYSTTQTECHWKGMALYHNIFVDGQENKDAAWYYPEPKEEAARIKNYVGFWRGVKVVELNR